MKNTSIIFILFISLLILTLTNENSKPNEEVTTKVEENKQEADAELINNQNNENDIKEYKEEELKFEEDKEENDNPYLEQDELSQMNHNLYNTIISEIPPINKETITISEFKSYLVKWFSQNEPESYRPFFLDLIDRYSIGFPDEIKTKDLHLYLKIEKILELLETITRENYGEEGVEKFNKEVIGEVEKTEL